MKTRTILGAIGQSFAAGLIVLSCLTAPIALAGEGALLGIIPGTPLIDFTGTTEQGCVYDADNDLLTITGTPGLTAFSLPVLPPFSFISGGNVTMTLNIDDAGVLSGGAFSVTGTVTDPAGPTLYASPLLTGTFTGGDYGIVDTNPTAGGTDQADARAVLINGSLAPLYSPDDIGITITMENSDFIDGYGGTMTDDWACARAKGVIGPTPPDDTAAMFECYSVNKVTLRDKPGTTDDTLTIQKGGFRFPAGVTFDPTTDDVVITIDGLVVSIPAGNFVQSGSNLDYTYTMASGATPYTVRLNVEKRTWELRLANADVSLIDNTDGVDVTLAIGDYIGTDNVLLAEQGNKLKYTANPVKSCDTNEDGMKLSCMASMTVEHSSGTLITKSTAAGDLLHRDTVFADSSSGDLGIFHTSCSVCLSCGDTDGNFTIVEISSLPGDNLADECGVVDASCP